MGIYISGGDSVKVNNKMLECNIILQHLFLHVDFITLCDNSNISIRGQQFVSLFDNLLKNHMF
jgi:hypothetical protein